MNGRPKAILLLLGALVGSFAHAESTDAVDCLPVRDVLAMQVIDDQTLLVTGRAQQQWHSVLSRRCAGLRRGMVLSLDVYGRSYCADDRVRANDRGGDLGFGASCRLGPFVPVGPGSQTVEAG